MNEELATAFDNLMQIIRTLRSPQGCEWDRAQTPQSLTPYLLEEAHELTESIHERNQSKIKEELGDLLLHILFQALIAEEHRHFTLIETIDHISQKLVRRHPHVFGEIKVNGVKDIKKNWEAIKLKEGRASLMDGLPHGLPALLQARRVQERASQVGFDWEKIDAVWEKLHEEIDELKLALKAHQTAEISAELGDILFTVVNLSRFLNVDPDQALRHTTQKFLKRFKAIESELADHGKTLHESSLYELDAIWNRLKTAEKSA